MSSVEDLTREALEAELTSTKAALIDAALIHAKLIQERDEARRDLGAILAVIHRDGGHHTGEHGLSQSVADAHATWASVVRERDEARAEVERLRARVRSVDRSTAYEGKAFSNGESSQEDLAIVASERDAARAEVERLRALLPPSAHTGVRNGPGEGSWAVFAEKVVEERDELRHKLAGEAAHIKSLEDLLVDAVRERDEAYVEIQKLRAERRQLKHRVMECLKWVGVVPYPNTKGFSEMIAVRDLATDTLEEIKE